jgi:hypothetical protein
MANVYVEPRPKGVLRAARSSTMSSRTKRTMRSALSKPSTKRSTGRKAGAIFLMSHASGT